MEKTQVQQKKINFQPSIDLEEITKKVIINYFTIDSKDLFSLLQKQEKESDKKAELSNVLEIGAFVKTKVQMVMDTDYINLRVKEMTDEFDKGLDSVKQELLSTIENKFDPAKTDSYTERINSFFLNKKDELERELKSSLSNIAETEKSLTTRIDNSFNPELKTSHISRFLDQIEKFGSEIQNRFDLNQTGSITYQMKEMIQETLGHDGELVRSLDKRFSFDNPESTITILQTNILRKLEEIKNELAAGKSAAEAEKAVLEKVPQKGFDFEDVLFENLQDFARLRGDIVENVSKSTGDAGRSMKGDLIYSVKSLNKKIVIEAKNRTRPETPNTLLPTLNQTKLNRGADLVIYIAASEDQLHKQIGIFQEYPPDIIITHLGLWEVALKIAISRLTLDSTELSGIDRQSVENEINSIKSSLSSFRSLKTSANTIIKEAERITQQSESIKKEISLSVTKLNDLLLDVI